MNVPMSLASVKDLFLNGLATLTGWPLIIFTIVVSVVCTFVLRGIQFTQFFRSWRVTLAPEVPSQGPKDDSMNPFQAFINTLSSNLGNSSIAGMAVAVYIGGPGAALWVLIIGILLMSVRFAEVYISSWFGAQQTTNVLGGPMLYLRSVPGGPILAWLYGFILLFYGLEVGNGMQANSIRVSLENFNIPPLVSAVILFLFVLYILLGGAKRIVKISDAIVPIKVILFFGSTFILLAYHYARLLPALKLILLSGLDPYAFGGGVIGASLQVVIRTGILQSISATESGLGTAAVMFGFTGSKDSVKDGLMGMLSTFISTLVCFIVVWCIVASGVWNNGLNSTALTISAFKTVFGPLGGWIVTFLSISFGIGVLVAYGYVTRAAWLYLFNGRYQSGFIVVYSLSCFVNTLLDVEVLWAIVQIMNALLLTINLWGILVLTVRMKNQIVKAIHS